MTAIGFMKLFLLITLKEKQWKERINHQIVKEQTNTDSEQEWQLRTARKFLRAEELRVENVWQFLIHSSEMVLHKETLNKNEKIKRKEEISNILKNGARWKCLLFTVIFRKNSLLFERVAILVSRRNGNAVTRNYIKRSLREIFRKNKRNHPPFFDIIIRPQQEILLKDKNEIETCYRHWIQYTENNG